MGRSAREVYFVDGVRTPFGKAGPKGQYWRTRADDLGVKAVRELLLGAVDVAIAGGIEHMGHHPMGADVDFNPRFVSERLIDESAAVMGNTAENLHDLFPAIT